MLLSTPHRPWIRQSVSDYRDNGFFLARYRELIKVPKDFFSIVKMWPAQFHKMVTQINT